MRARPNIRSLRRRSASKFPRGIQKPLEGIDGGSGSSIAFEARRCISLSSFPSTAPHRRRRGRLSLLGLPDSTINSIARADPAGLQKLTPFGCSLSSFFLSPVPLDKLNFDRSEVLRTTIAVASYVGCSRWQGLQFRPY
jgi:hypothetical protein